MLSEMTSILFFSLNYLHDSLQGGGGRLGHFSKTWVYPF